MTWRTVVVALLAIGGLFIAAPAWARVWTDKYGKTMNARFVRVDFNRVVLQRGSRTVTVPIDELCLEDQEYVRRLVAGEIVDEDAGADSPFKPVTPPGGETEAENSGGVAWSNSGTEVDTETVDKQFENLEHRTWTDLQGRRMKARFAGVDGREVLLHRGGKTLSFPYANFSYNDQRYVRDTLEEHGLGHLVSALEPPLMLPGRGFDPVPPGAAVPSPRSLQDFRDELQRRQSEAMIPTDPPGGPSGSPPPGMSPPGMSPPEYSQPAFPGGPGFQPPSFSPPSFPSGPSFEPPSFSPPSMPTMPSMDPPSFSGSSSTPPMTPSFTPPATPTYTPPAVPTYRAPATRYACTKCKKVLPANVKVGDRCPNCGVYLAFQEGGGSQKNTEIARQVDAEAGTYVLPVTYGIGAMAAVIVMLSLIVWILNR